MPQVTQHRDHHDVGHGEAAAVAVGQGADAYAIEAASFERNEVERFFAELDRFADLHNRYLLDIRNDRDRMRRFGLTPGRIDAALFTGENLRKLLANFSTAGTAIDQSDLARFLVTVMSTETCRKLVVAAEQAGFVERVRSPFGAVLVSSRGTIETIYGNVLREARLDAARY